MFNKAARKGFGDGGNIGNRVTLVTGFNTLQPE